MKKYRLPHLLLALLGMGFSPAWGQEEGNVAHEMRVASLAQASASGSQPEANDGNTALVRIDRFEIKGNTLLDAGLIERLLSPFKGDARGYTDIQLALEALEGAYRSAGYSAVHVVTPEQEITQGTVTLQVIETVVGKVILSGNQHYDKKNIRNALPALAEGYTPSARELSENIRLANENPTRQIDVVLAIGEEENTVDAKVNVQDSSPHKIFVTLDNTGNQSTGMYRTGVGYQHNNLFNRDQAATFNYVTSPDHVKDVTQISASYRLPIYSLGDSVDLIAAYSNVNIGSAATTAGSIVVSNGRVYSARYNHYLARQGEYTSKVIGGFDYRSNTCTIIAIDCPNITAPITVHPLSLAYSGTQTGPTTVSDFSASITHNLGGGARGDSAYFIKNLGAGAKADYTVLRFNGSVAGILPESWQYRAAWNTQYTRDVLIPGESLGLVGANAVRGFIEREVSGDKGYVFNLELYTPELAPQFRIKGGSLRLLGFADRARGWYDALSLSNSKPGISSVFSVGSVGLGLRYSHGKNVSAKLDWAKVTGAGGTSKTGDSRGQFSVMASW